MKAIVIARYGDPSVLELRDVPAPEPGYQCVRVRVTATAVNRADVLQRLGRYPAPPDASPDVPGLEFSGVVDRNGAGATRFEPGTPVFGLAGGGSYAEYIVAHERTLARVPEGLDLVTAGGVPEAYVTAHDALFVQANLRPGERVLVHAVGSGVGLAAAQLAHRLGAEVFGTARTPEKLERARTHGLAHGLLAEGFADAALALTGGSGVDVVLDLVGAGYLAENVRALAPRGRMLCVGTLAGAKGELDLGAVLRKRLSITGTVLRARPVEEKILANRAFEREVVPQLARGALAPVIDRVFPLAEAAQAHARMESNESFGKILLRVS